MCLIIKRIRHLNGKAKVAKRDIPCLKILCVTDQDNLVTPYKWTSIGRNEAIDGLFADEFAHQTKFPLIEHGIHSYKPTHLILTIPGEMIVKAYIPKGTKYWIGCGGEYVSQCIKFN